MPALSLDEETQEQVIARMTRELAHISEQCQVAHTMAQDWRRRCLMAEAQHQRLERKYRNLRKRKGLEHEADELDETPHEDEALSLPAVW
jgi:hypothetical protein